MHFSCSLKRVAIIPSPLFDVAALDPLIGFLVMIPVAMLGIRMSCAVPAEEAAGAVPLC